MLLEKQFKLYDGKLHLSYKNGNHVTFSLTMECVITQMFKINTKRWLPITLKDFLKHVLLFISRNEKRKKLLCPFKICSGTFGKKLFYLIKNMFKKYDSLSEYLKEWFSVCDCHLILTLWERILKYINEYEIELRFAIGTSD